MSFGSGTPPPRPNSRRHEPRPYRIERLGLLEDLQRRDQGRTGLVWALTEAGRTGSALRLALAERGIDPKQARLVLLFYGRERHRVADVAWKLNVSPSTASRWLDKAEREGLVDKYYDLVDRRGTAARLTRAGVELRQAVERVLRTMPRDRPRGIAMGVRQATPCPNE
jgi:DNA-binding MarR family transcriptional regulator